VSPRRDSNSLARPNGSDARVVELLERLVAGIEALRDDLRRAPTEPALLGATAVAKLLDINPRTFRQLRHAGDAPRSITIGAVAKWRRSDIDAWLAEKAGE
jgi:predicted DNA-binding transcriptional regulator AlpA